MASTSESPMLEKGSGLAFTSSYVLGHADQSRFLSKRFESPMVRNDGEEGDVTHAFKLNAVYPLPFGRGRRNALTLKCI